MGDGRSGATPERKIVFSMISTPKPPVGRVFNPTLTLPDVDDQP
jgi:hypothetical protein